MNARTSYWLGSTFGLCIALLTILTSCDYSPPRTFERPTGTFRETFSAKVDRPGSSKSKVAATTGTEREGMERTAILDSSITLIQRASLQPGGRNFDLAIQKLNQYFEGTPVKDYELDSATKEFLKSQLPSDVVQNMQNSRWELRDARHVEDCMMYYSVANRVAGTGDDLTRATRLFDWLVRQIQLVPPESLGAPGLRQSYARPYDVLMRGIATEADGYWAERSWVFMSLCRQIGLDSGLIAYKKGNRVESPARKVGFNPDPIAKLLGVQASNMQPIIWICGVLIDGKIYLFDARVGMPIPGPGGKGIATLDQAMDDPEILERMNLPGESPYATSRASLLASPDKISILLDSGLSLYSPKMNLLQRQLSGKNRTILYRDLADERSKFEKALGSHLGKIGMWMLPLEVETRLFTDAQFVQSTQLSLLFFRMEFPLVYARVKHLRGDIEDAVKEYVAFRFAENAMMINVKQPIPKEIQEGLDVYSSYYLALADLEKNNLDQAAVKFRKLLDVLPAPDPSQPYFNMFRWGANTNLARIHENKGEFDLAIAYYTEADPTMQHHGNLLAARELALKNPSAKGTVKLPPPPKSRYGPTAKAAAPETKAEAKPEAKAEAKPTEKTNSKPSENSPEKPADKP